MKKKIKPSDKFQKEFLKLVFGFFLSFYLYFWIAIKSTGERTMYYPFQYDFDVYILIFAFIFFSLSVLNISIDFVKEIGKESIQSLFYAVPLSVVYFPLYGFSLGLADITTSKGSIIDFKQFFENEYAGLSVTIILTLVIYYFVLDKIE